MSSKKKKKGDFHSSSEKTLKMRLTKSSQIESNVCIPFLSISVCRFKEEGRFMEWGGKRTEDPY